MSVKSSFRSWVNNLKQPRRREIRYVQLRVEELEHRNLLSVSLWSPITPAVQPATSLAAVVSSPSTTSNQTQVIHTTTPTTTTNSGTLTSNPSTPVNTSVVSPSTTTSTPTASNALFVSMSGNDANSGTSASSAFRNINTALAHIRSGQTLYIQGGTYYEHVVVNTGGITIASYNGTATIDGSYLGWTAGADQNKGVVELNASGVTLSGLRVVNSPDTGIVLNANNLTVTGCEVAYTQRHAISTNTSRQTNWAGYHGTMIQNITITNNNVHDAVLKGNGYGQAISLIANGFNVSGNTVHNNRTEGIDIWLGAQNGTVSNNVVYGNGAAGIYEDGASYVTISGNQVYNNPRGIGVSSECPYYASHDIKILNNSIHDNSSGAGVFFWDDLSNPGYAGIQNVTIQGNQFARNQCQIYLYGSNDSGTITGNSGIGGWGIYNQSTNSSFNTYGNS